MKSEYRYRPEASREVKEQETPTASPKFSRAGQMNMSTPLPPEEYAYTPPMVSSAQEKTTKTDKPSLPRPDNPEPKEVTGSIEAVPGCDGGLPKTPPPSGDDSAAAGRARIQATLNPGDSPSQPNPATLPPVAGDATLSSASPSLPATDTTTVSQPTDNTILPPVSSSLPATDTTAMPQPTDNTVIPPVSPSLPTTDTTTVSQPMDNTILPPVSPPLPINVVTESVPAIPAVSTGDAVVSPVNSNAIPSDAVIASSVSLSDSIGTRVTSKNDTDVRENADLSVTIPPKFEKVEDVNQYYKESIANFGDSPTNQKFLNYLEQHGISLSELAERQVDGNFSNYLTQVHSLAHEAGLSDAQAGTVVHRLGELHTMKRYPEEVASGERLLEQTVFYVNDEGNIKKKELDRVTIRGDVHHIQDIKPIHLGTFVDTPAGQQWVQEMTDSHGVDFQEQINQGQLNPFNGLSVESRRALKTFSKNDLAKHQTQLQTYEDLYREANPHVKKVKAYVQPYYKL